MSLIVFRSEGQDDGSVGEFGISAANFQNAFTDGIDLKN